MDGGFDQARSLAYRLLAFRPRTRRELETRLKQKGFASEVTLQVIALMERCGYVDDQAFARLWVEQRQAKRGSPGMRRELLEKGVDGRIVDEVLEELGPDVEYGVAMKLAKKKVELCGGACPYPRLARFLDGRGFTKDVVSNVCRALCEKRGNT